MKTKLKWEQITEDGSTWRLRVLFGWLVRYSDDVVHDRSECGQGLTGGWDWRSCMVFVPDECGIWVIEKEEKSCEEGIK